MKNREQRRRRNLVENRAKEEWRVAHHETQQKKKKKPTWNFFQKPKKTRKASPKTEDDLKWSGAPKIWWTIYRAEEERRVAHHCEQNRVTVLHLPGVALSGQLPNGISGNLTLSLRLNALTGSLPSDLAACTTCTSKVISLPVILLSVGKMVELES